MTSFGAQWGGVVTPKPPIVATSLVGRYYCPTFFVLITDDLHWNKTNHGLQECTMNPDAVRQNWTMEFSLSAMALKMEKITGWSKTGEMSWV